MTSLEPVCLSPEGPDILNKKKEGNGCDVIQTGNDVSKTGNDVIQTGNDVKRTGNDVTRAGCDVILRDDHEMKRLQQ